MTAIALLSLASCKSKEAPAPVLDVKLVELKDTTFRSEMYLPATIKGIQDVAIYPQVEGRITEIRVYNGQRVRAGQVLFVIDQIPYRAALDVAIAAKQVAESEVASAQLTVESKQKLFDQDVISEYQLKLAKNQLLTAKAQLAQAEAEVTNAKNNYSFTEVTAPVSGLVGELPYKLGTLVSPQISMPLTSISDNSVLEIKFSVPENAYLMLSENNVSIDKIGDKEMEVEFIKNDGTRYEEKGYIKSASGIISEQTGAISVRANFPNPNGYLLSGGAGRIALPFTVEDAVLVPRTAIKEIQNKMFVFKVDKDGFLLQTEVKAERINSAQWQLLPMEDGSFPVKAGDIITSTTNKLKTGDQVKL